MEVLPFEKVERVVGARKKLQQKALYIQNSEYCNNLISTYYSFSEDSSDEEEYKIPLAASEKSSVCCVCGDNIPFLDKLIEHFKTHTAVVYCHLCHTKFGRVMSLALHLKNAHAKDSHLCEVCGALFSCTWHLNGHIGMHQKDNMKVKPVVKSEETEAVSIAKTSSCIDLKRAITMDHTYFDAEQNVASNTSSRLQKHTDGETNSIDENLHIKTEAESVPLDEVKQNETFSSSSFQNQIETEHLSFELKQENDNELEDMSIYKVVAEEVIGPTGDEESTDTDEDANPDSLPPGDTAYNPDEDFSSDSDYNESCRSQQKRLKPQTPDKKASVNANRDLTDIEKKFCFQSDSPFCCYGKFANLGKHMDDCSKKPMMSCCLCKVACKNEESLLKHMTEKHPKTSYICSTCRKVFPRQENLKNHVCLIPRGNMVTPLTQLPNMPLPYSSGQGKPIASALHTNQSTVKILNFIPAVNKVSTDPPRPVASLGSTEALTLHQLLQTTPAVTPKVTNLVPQVVAVPQTLMRSSFAPSLFVSHPNIPVSTPSVVRPLLLNPPRLTIRVPTPSSRPLPIVVSFSPTVNTITPALVSSSRTALRQRPVPKIRPVPVNIPPVTSVACPTLVSALTRNNQSQVPPAQIQAPLRIVGMYMNHMALQKPLEQSWSSKTIFPCRHCGAVSRQPSMRVRHRYLHRGSRLYRCQCGRSFQRQLHLLRHQVQHAESVQFVCTWCGNTFKGAHELTSHKRKHKKGTRQVKKKCKVVFDCSCGQIFARPSALLWHMLKNTKHTGRNPKPVTVLNCLNK